MERQEKWPEDWTDAEAWRVRLEEVHKMQWKNEDGTSKHPTRSAEHFKKRVLPYSVHWAGPSRRVSVATLAKRGFEHGFTMGGWNDPWAGEQLSWSGGNVSAKEALMVIYEHVTRAGRGMTVHGKLYEQVRGLPKMTVVVPPKIASQSAARRRRQEAAAEAPPHLRCGQAGRALPGLRAAEGGGVQRP